MPDRPKFTKSSPELVQRYRAVLDRHAAPDITLKPMFGYSCAWIAGNMVSGLFAEDWWVRLSEPDRESLLTLPGAHQFEVMPGKAMGRYVVLPPDVVASDEAVDPWLIRAIDFTRTLPPKR
ncbi:MAG TPA: TfoX/Sxy family protein [Candidatus Eisenbacteria bacterium]|nr:TfoX/Sxy family protein [Candidatus Eisenbacteria bacterium]